MAAQGNGGDGEMPCAHVLDPCVARAIYIDERRRMLLVGLPARPVQYRPVVDGLAVQVDEPDSLDAPREIVTVHVGGAVSAVEAVREWRVKEQSIADGALHRAFVMLVEHASADPLIHPAAFLPHFYAVHADGIDPLGCC